MISTVVPPWRARFMAEFQVIDPAGVSMLVSRYLLDRQDADVLVAGMMDEGYQVWVSSVRPVPAARGSARVVPAGIGVLG
jgi:hypothetical protein